MHRTNISEHSQSPQPYQPHCLTQLSMAIKEIKRWCKREPSIQPQDCITLTNVERTLCSDCQWLCFGPLISRNTHVGILIMFAGFGAHQGSDVEAFLLGTKHLSMFVNRTQKHPWFLSFDYAATTRALFESTSK